MAKLIFTDKNFSGRVYELALEKTTVGRGEQNTLVIHDSSLSARHCEILMYGTEIIVRDLDSLNGTFVDGVRLNKQSQMKSGQTVRFGTVEARLELGPCENDTDPSQVTAVYEMRKVMREQRQAAHQPKPATASMQLEPDTPPAPENQTILLPRTDVSRPAPSASAPGKTEPLLQKHPRGKLTLIIGLAVLGLVVLIWLVWGRK